MIKVKGVQCGGRWFCERHPTVETTKLPAKGGFYDVICEDCESGAKTEWVPTHKPDGRCWHR